jgi:hypothetical protein
MLNAPFVLLDDARPDGAGATASGVAALMPHGACMPRAI